MLKRLPLNIKIFNKNGEMVQSITTTKKSEVLRCGRDFFDLKWQFGTCRVWYSKQKDYWNEFSFRSLDEFSELYDIDTDVAMLKDFLADGTLSRAYVSRRTISPKQRQARRGNLKSYATSR